MQFDAEVDCVEQDLDHVLVFERNQIWIPVLLGQVKHVLQVASLEVPAQIVEVAVVEALVQGEDPLGLLEVVKRPLDAATGLKECLDALLSVVRQSAGLLRL